MGLEQFPTFRTPPKYADIIATTVGSPVEIIAAVANTRLVVIHWYVTGVVAGTMQFLSAATPISGAIAVAALTPAQWDDNPEGLMITAAGEALNLGVAGVGNTINGYLVYRELE